MHAHARMCNIRTHADGTNPTCPSRPTGRSPCGGAAAFRPPDKLEQELQGKLLLLEEETAKNVHARAEIELFSAIGASSAALEYLTLAAKEAAAGRSVSPEAQATGHKALVDLAVHAERLRRLLHPGAYEHTDSDGSAVKSRSGSSTSTEPPDLAAAGGAPGPLACSAPHAPAAAIGVVADEQAAHLAGSPCGGAGDGVCGDGGSCSAALRSATAATMAAAARGPSRLETTTASHPVTSVDFTLR